MDQEYKKDVFRIALFAGELMLTNGAETYRVEDTVLRMCNCRGFKHVNVFVSPTVIIISDERFDGITFMKTIKTRGISLNKINELNTFSREFVSNPNMELSEALVKLKRIESIVTYKAINSLIATGLGSAFFAIILGANGIDFIFTFLVSMLAVKSYSKVVQISSIPLFATMTASFIIALCGVILKELNLINTPNMLIVGSIMPLLPGVALIKGLRDLISGDLISGVARAFDASMIAIAIATGVGFTLKVWVNLGGVF